MFPSSIAVISQAAVFVNVHSVEAGSQTVDGATNSNRPTSYRLLKAQLAPDVWKLCSAFDIDQCY